MRNFKFSIITVVKNDPGNLEITLKSILDQECSNYELIVIDGNSGDETLKVLKKYRNNIDVLITEPDKGIYDAMNKGIKLANGEWLHFLNAGDSYFSKDVLNKIASFDTNVDCNLIYTLYEQQNSIIGANFSQSYFIRNMYCHQAIFYSRKLFNNSFFDETLTYCADYKHILQNWGKIIPVYIPEVTITYLGGGLSAKSENIYGLRKERFMSSLHADFSVIYKSMAIIYTFIRRII